MRSRIPAIHATVLLALALTAHGQFLRLPRYDNGMNFSYFLNADINQDGKTDIIGMRLGFTGGEDITVLLGNGNGGFGAPINTSITGIDKVDNYQFLLGDFNGDGQFDVAVFGIDHVTGQNVVAVLLGNGGGTFQTPRETILPSAELPKNGACVANVGDYNGDDKVDIAYLGGPIIVVLPGKGDGTFSAAITTSSVAGFGCVVTGDLNNDKKLDLALVDHVNGAAVMLGNGDGTFQSPRTITTAGVRGNYITAAELNGDGNLDLVVGPGVTVLLGDGAGSFPTIHTCSNLASGGEGEGFQGPPAVQDLNGDGHPDIALFGGPTDARFIGICLNNGDGSFTPGKKLYVADGANSSFGLVAADLNGDEKVDFAFGNAAGGISVMRGNGDGTFKGNAAFLPSFEVTFDPPTFSLIPDLVVGDFNGDLKPDLLLSTGGFGEVLLGNGEGTFTQEPSIDCGLGFAIGDFNRDGKLDVANLDNGISICLGNGDGTLTPGDSFDVGVQHKLVLVGDFNNDGKLDLAASDLNGISILLGNGDGTFQEGIPTAVGNSFPNFAVGKFNGDSYLDVVAETASGIAVLPGKGDGTFGPAVVSPGPTTGLLTVADLNKDGKSDLLITSGSDLFVMLGNGNGTFKAPVPYSLGATSIPTRAVVADFNLDGNPDVAVGDSSGMVDIFFGDCMGKLLTPPTRFEAGGPTAAIATADFNGDKKPDLAVTLLPVNSGSNWYVVTLLHQ
jgi:hypothetical protein